jgi:hypothetical protein
LREYLSRVKDIAKTVSESTEKNLGSLAEQTSPDDKSAWLELFSDDLYSSEEFSKLALDIKDSVEQRFDSIANGLERSSTDWPRLWSFKCENREEFLRQVRWFSDNHFSRFGKLLTPLVEGIRVSGPFRPMSAKIQGPGPFVLIDGQGIGHTADSVSSIPTRVTSRFTDLDMILLVDSVKHPLQAAPMSLLRAVASAGYSNKLAVAFTHVDLLRGDIFKTASQKRSHVLASIANTTTSLRQTLGAPVAAALERQLEENFFLLGGLDKEIADIPAGIISELSKLLEKMKASKQPDPLIEVHPIYATQGLESALRDAVESFLRPWEARLGKTSRDGIRKEHWTRVKALSRAIANGKDGYQELLPVSDLIARFQEEITRWLNSPADWRGAPVPEDEQTAAIDSIRRLVYEELHKLANDRLISQRHADWIAAYLLSGKGSTIPRTEAIWRIYQLAAPPINSAMDKQARDFLARIVRIVRKAVEETGGSFESI